MVFNTMKVSGGSLVVLTPTMSWEIRAFFEYTGNSSVPLRHRLSFVAQQA